MCVCVCVRVASSTHFSPEFLGSSFIYEDGPREVMREGVEDHVMGNQLGRDAKARE